MHVVLDEAAENDPLVQAAIDKCVKTSVVTRTSNRPVHVVVAGAAENEPLAQANKTENTESTPNPTCALDKQRTRNKNRTSAGHQS